MRGVSTEQQLRSRIDELEVELARRVDEAEEKELQLQRYAADLRETFMQERARSEELHRSYMLTVRALASAVEARDAYTGRHAERVAAYGLALAEVYGMRLGAEPEIEFGFLLHDAGKVAVPDAILFKPGPLTAAERTVMEQHPVTGSEIVRDIDFLGAARDVIRSHHERWDGGGYPDGLAREDIPVSARVFAVADTLDALTTRRPYREPSSIAHAREIIEAGSGTHFDPQVIVAFKALPDRAIETIRERIGR
jgi:ribonuclease P protein subunit RPR2